MWYVCDVLYAVLYVCVSCFVVRVCAVSRRNINVYNCDMFSVVNVYLDHLRFCVVCINGRRYVCCSECNVFDSVYVDLQYDEISLTFTAGSVCLCGVCSQGAVFSRSVMLS